MFDKINKLLSAEIPENEYPRQEKKFWKFWLVMFFMNLSIVVIVAKLFFVQVIDRDKYIKISKKQHESMIELPAHRGIIYDRNKKILATNINSISIAVDPVLIEKKQELINIISEGLNYNRSSIEKKVNDKSRRFTWLARGVLPHKIEGVFSLKDRGLILVEEPKRYYPYGEAGAQVIGFTNIDNAGIGGIELQFDDQLKGNDGYVIMRKDGHQNLHETPELPRIEPEDGNSVELTLDIDLQRIVQFELEKGIEWSEAAGGTVIAVEVKTGEILAIASYPFFDPNRRETIKSVNTRLRALTDEYAPGSTFKIVTASAAFEEDIIEEDDSLYGYNGQMVFNWGIIRDVHPLGPTNFREATWQSSNIVYANLANEIEDRKFFSYVRNFGFGNKLDIDLPGEIPGKLKKPENFNNSSKRYMGHGYDFTATALQVVSAYATIANGGELMQPHILRKIINEEEVLEERKPTRIRRVISNKTADRISELFVGVVDSGSGKRAKIEELKIVGKTGTSQKIGPNGRYSKSDYIASFCGYYPANEPEIAMIVIIDRPRKSIYGGVNAAPVFKRITESWVQASGIGDNEIEIASVDSLILPDFTGIKLKRAKEIASDLDLELQTNYDNGIVFYQKPDPGQKVKRDSKVMLTLMGVDEDFKPGKLDLRGMPLRNALNMLHTYGIRTEVVGKGKISKQYWKKDSKGMICKLVCS